MIKIIQFILALLITEALLAVIFYIVAAIFYKKTEISVKSVVKGFTERLFLLIALVNGYSQALTFFSALKLGTRLKHQEPQPEMDRFNDYYLIGNLTSVAIAIGYTWIYHSLFPPVA